MNKLSHTPVDGRIRFGLGSAVLGGILTGAASVFEVLYVLSLLGQSITANVSLTGSMSIFVSLYLFLGLSSAAMGFVGGYLLWRGYSRASTLTNVIGALTALASLTIPPYYGQGIPLTTLATMAAGALLMVSSAALGSVSPQVIKPKTPILDSVEVATTAVFSALYAVMILILIIPSPTGGYTHFGDTIVFLAALLFGYRVGGLVGVLGAVAADLYTGYARWYVSILAHGLEGIVPGLARRGPLWMQVIASVAGGFLMATTYFFINIFIKGYSLALISYARDLLVQAGVSIVLATIVSNVVKRVLPQFR